MMMHDFKIGDKVKLKDTNKFLGYVSNVNKGNLFRLDNAEISVHIGNQQVIVKQQNELEYYLEPMKWLSIKELISPTNSNVLLRLERKNTNGYIFVRYVVTFCDKVYEHMDDINNWRLSDGRHADINVDEYVVTHFCIIED